MTKLCFNCHIINAKLQCFWFKLVDVSITKISYAKFHENMWSLCEIFLFSRVVNFSVDV
jgi:hypothetical protein